MPGLRFGRSTLTIVGGPFLKIDPKATIVGKPFVEVENKKMRVTTSNMHRLSRRCLLPEARFGQNDGIEITGIQPRQARGDVAANGLNIQIRASAAQLRDPARAASPDPSALRQVFERAPDQHVANVFAFGKVLAQAQRRTAGHVLERVHRCIDTAVEDGGL